MRNGKPIDENEFEHADRFRKEAMTEWHGKRTGRTAGPSGGGSLRKGSPHDVKYRYKFDGVLFR